MTYQWGPTYQCGIYPDPAMSDKSGPTSVELIWTEQFWTNRKPSSVGLGRDRAMSEFKSHLSLTEKIVNLHYLWGTIFLG